MIILVSDKVEFKTEGTKWNKVYYIMLTENKVHNERIVVMHHCAPNHIESNT